MREPLAVSTLARGLPGLHFLIRPPRAQHRLGNSVAGPFRLDQEVSDKVGHPRIWFTPAGAARPDRPVSERSTRRPIVAQLLDGRLDVRLDFPLHARLQLQQILQIELRKYRRGGLLYASVRVADQIAQAMLQVDRWHHRQLEYDTVGSRHAARTEFRVPGTAGLDRRTDHIGHRRSGNTDVELNGLAGRLCPTPGGGLHGDHTQLGFGLQAETNGRIAGPREGHSLLGRTVQRHRTGDLDGNGHILDVILQRKDSHRQIDQLLRSHDARKRGEHHERLAHVDIRLGVTKGAFVSSHDHRAY